MSDVNYETLYHFLFNSLTDYIEQLKTLQQSTEALYIEMRGEEQE